MQVESMTIEKELVTFSRILNKGLADVILVQSQKAYIKIEAKEEFIDSLHFEVLGGQLILKMKDVLETGIKSIVNLSRPKIAVEIGDDQLGHWAALVAGGGHGGTRRVPSAAPAS